MQTNWSKQEDDTLRQAYYLDRPVKEIALLLNRSEGAVRGRASALGISKGNTQDTTAIGFDSETACPHCGQIQLSGAECSCHGAKKAAKVANQIIRANEAIQETFGEQCKAKGFIPVTEENIIFLQLAAEQIANCKFYAIAFVLPSGTRAKLTRGAKGTIKVERSETKKVTQDVDE
ncbi:MAG: hypothetical protein LBL82_00270 [Oscillospiraceae bacterium]|jgi:hypothetical protein|nr:hypothetical protein [Oscillospiraceae bacterium]